jgi:hypothetical protein
MGLAEFVAIGLQYFGTFVPLWAVVFIVSCLKVGIIFAMIVMILRRV